ncbi:hypothetical protein HK105_202738 [Polyrhizophydium stewartii]|uniref:Patatin-like phospholipase n=1 Tax=Polyrhizophydium stewartii TaxID=2732419 RepID=A0ABR4NEC6_9FUNG
MARRSRRPAAPRQRAAHDAPALGPDRAFEFKPSLRLRTDPAHRAALRDKDLGYFRIFVGPAAGPRAFVSAGFEKRLKRLLANGRITEQTWLVGGSTGALRFTALLSGLASGRNLTWELKEHYCNMYYKKGDTPAVLKPMMERAYQICAPRKHIDAVLGHPQLRLAILVANVWPMFQPLPDLALQAVFAGFFVGNILSQRVMGGLAQRICFYTGPDPPVFLDNGVGGKGGIQYVPLTSTNIYQVLHATTCVPFVQERCTFIEGVGTGLFVDGGLTDYYLNSHFTDPDLPALLLADVPDCNVYQTVFDCMLPWQRSAPEHMFDNCSAVYPSRTYLEALPESKLPSMSDWFDERFIALPERRHMHWRTTFDLSERLWHHGIHRAKSMPDLHAEAATAAQDAERDDVAASDRDARGRTSLARAGSLRKPQFAG